jgi:hypothetical protein
MKKLAIAAAVIAAAVPSVAIAAGGLSGTYKTTVHTTALGGALNGTWKIKFTSNGYMVSFGGKVVVSGRNAYNGPRIVFNDTSGADKCSGSGVYTYKLTGNKLTFTKVSDTQSCIGRQLVLKGTLTKVG